MKLKDMIETLRTALYNTVEIRNKEGFVICTCNTTSPGVVPYLERNITEWFPGSPPFRQNKIDFVVFIDLED